MVDSQAKPRQTAQIVSQGTVPWQKQVNDAPTARADPTQTAITILGNHDVRETRCTGDPSVFVRPGDVTKVAVAGWHTYSSCVSKIDERPVVRVSQHADDVSRLEASMGVALPVQLLEQLDALADSLQKRLAQDTWPPCGEQQLGCRLAGSVCAPSPSPIPWP